MTPDLPALAGVARVGLTDASTLMAEPMPQAEWGQMVAQGTQFFPAQWWLSAFPAIAIVFSALAFALIADGLTELFRRGVGGT